MRNNNNKKQCLSIQTTTPGTDCTTQRNNEVHPENKQAL